MKQFDLEKGEFKILNIPTQLPFNFYVFEKYYKIILYLYQHLFKDDIERQINAGLSKYLFKQTVYTMYLRYRVSNRLYVLKVLLNGNSIKRSKKN